MSDRLLFPDFRSFDVGVPDGAGGQVRLHAVAAGTGPAVLLLHGYPQTHAIWHRVAPKLVAAGHMVVASDLRGYGDSGKPASAPDHAPYSKRAMAADQVALMRVLGHPRFHLVGHDRGGRVAHRLALDHPEAVASLAVLDIAPTRHMYLGTTQGFARAYFHWFFLVQPEPMPERMIGADPQAFLRFQMGRRHAGLDVFDPVALADYIRCFSDPETIHASCEDYRAAIGIDLAHDEADLSHRIEAPLLALWGRHGAIESYFDCLASWRERASHVTGRALDCGHYLPEEAPDAVVEALLAHMA